MFQPSDCIRDGFLLSLGMFSKLWLEESAGSRMMMPVDYRPTTNIKVAKTLQTCAHAWDKIFSLRKDCHFLFFQCDTYATPTNTPWIGWPQFLFVCDLGQLSVMAIRRIDRVRLRSCSASKAIQLGGLIQIDLAKLFCAQLRPRCFGLIHFRFLLHI